MKKTILVIGAVAGSSLLAGALIACSSSSTPAPNTSDVDSGSKDGGSATTDGTANFGSFGKACTNPINTGGGGGGGTGAEGGTNADGGVDPACTGVYDLCASIGSTVQCTKSCTYSGAGMGGPQANPTDCPNPPTNGMCTPRGFCQ